MEIHPEVKTEPYLPLPYRKGSEIVNVYDVDFEDEAGNKAIIKKCDFINKKGKKQLGFDLQVTWEQEKPLPNHFKRKFLDAFNDYEMDDVVVWYDGPVQYYFKFEDKLYLAIVKNSNFDYFVFELGEKIENDQYHDFYSHCELLQRLAKGVFLIKPRSHVEDVLLFGNKAKYAFECYKAKNSKGKV